MRAGKPARTMAETVLRHPQRIPLEVSPAPEHAGADGAAEGLALLAFRSPTGQRPGMLLRIRFPVDPSFETAARVRWCQPSEEGFEVAVCLPPGDAYRARMAEQLCHIEAYRCHVAETEGRRLDPESAAREWIQRYAAEFPTLEPAT